MPTRFSVSVVDASREQATMSFYTRELTATNFGAQIVQAGLFQGALQDVIRGAQAKIEFNRSLLANPAITNDPNAQREAKWLVTYRDVTEFLDNDSTVPNPGYNKLFTCEIPTAMLADNNNARLIVVGRDDADLSLPVWQGFVTRFEAFACSPYNWVRGAAAAISVVNIKYVGRNT